VTALQPLALEHPVITIVRFPAGGSTLEPAAARALFERTAPAYRAVPGLRRKLFLQGDGVGGGLYEWRSRADAEGWFSPAWHARMRATYGVEPTLEWFEAPCIVDNVRGAISFDAAPGATGEAGAMRP
jgi:hypothetical protein